MPVTLRSISASVHSLDGGQVQVGEEHLAGAHPRVFLGDRLLDLEDQLGGPPHLVGVGQDRRAGRLVVPSVIEEPAPAPAWTNDLVPGAGELDTPRPG